MVPLASCIRRLAVARGFMLTVTLVPVLNQAFAETPINWGKDNPYQSVVTHWLSLPSEQRDAIESWAEPFEANKAATMKLSAQQEQIVADLTSAVRLAAQDTREAKWLMTLSPTDPDNPAALSPAYLSPMRQLGQITLQSAATASPAEAINNYLAVTQMGRQLRQNPTFIIKQLCGLSLEAKSTQAMVERLNEFSVADLDRLTNARARLKPVPSLETIFREGERNQFFTRYWTG